MILNKYGVLTIATGRQLYLDMAFNLARSFALWHRHSDIKFYLVTDIEGPTPRDLDFVQRVQKTPQEMARGFSSKLYLDQLAPAEKTLFIDSDCLCLRNLDEVFHRFAGQPVSVVGTMKSEGEWFGDIHARCQRYAVAAVPVFVGAVYYLELGAAASRVFETAREIEKEYDAAGFIRLRGVVNEEPLISVGMAQVGCRPLADDGALKVDAMYWKSVRMNILEGKAEVTMHDGAILRPDMLHFNCSFAEKPPYTNEVMTLKLACLSRWPPFLARAVGKICCYLPHVIWQGFLDTFRPIYRRFFGFRKIKISPRISQEISQES